MEGNGPRCRPTGAWPLARDDLTSFTRKSCIFEHPLYRDYIGFDLDCLADDPVERLGYLFSKANYQSATLQRFGKPEERRLKHTCSAYDNDKPTKPAETPVPEATAIIGNPAAPKIITEPMNSNRTASHLQNQECSICQVNHRKGSHLLAVMDG